jgi:hypothetical protein
MYEEINRSTATLFGRDMSKPEARGIIQEASILAGKINRLLAGDHFYQISGDVGRGDLTKYWTHLFDSLSLSVDDALLQIANFYFRLPQDAQRAAENWADELHNKTEDLLTFGMAQNGEFLMLAEDAIPKFSQRLMISNPLEPQLTNSEAIVRLERLKALFERFPGPWKPMESIFVDTQNFGVVTVSKYRCSEITAECAFAVGINIWRLDCPSVGFQLDTVGHASPLLLKNSLGRVATLKDGFIPPTADALIQSVLAAVRRFACCAID